jgi:hypothetical protein
MEVTSWSFGRQRFAVSEKVPDADSSSRLVGDLACLFLPILKR